MVNTGCGLTGMLLLEKCLCTNKRQIQSTSKRIHAFFLCSSVFAKLTLGRDKAFPITGLSFWTSLLHFFIFFLDAKSEFFHISFPNSLPSISPGGYLIYVFFRHPEPLLSIAPSCFPEKWWTPKWRKKWDVVNHPSGLHKNVLIPVWTDNSRFYTVAVSKWRFLVFLFTLACGHPSNYPSKKPQIRSFNSQTVSRLLLLLFTQLLYNHSLL